MTPKSTPEEIRARFDNDVERFSNIETGQTATMDSQLMLDLVTRADPAIQALLWARFGDHLAAQQDAAYRDRVFAYIEKEDTPRSLVFQLDALRAAGFTQVEVLHKNGPFAAFGALKG